MQFSLSIWDARRPSRALNLGTPRTPRHMQHTFDMPDLDGRRDRLLSQTEPLLATSSNGFGRAKGRHGCNNLTLAVRASLYIDITLVLFLLLIMLVSFERPGILDGVISGSQIDATGWDTTDIVIDQADDVSSHLPLPAPDPNAISYGDYTAFPLTPLEYRAECYKFSKGFMVDAGYWAQKQSDVAHPTLGVGEQSRICMSTITYMLGGDVGLLADLALMAQVAGLARERNRTFFVDHTYWNRGKLSDYFQDVHIFQPGPEPGCKSPPPEELVACPRTARHWVVNSQTAKFHFGHSFFEEYEDPFAMNINRLKRIYQMASESFTDIFQPTVELRELIQQTRSEFASLFPHSGPLSYVSVHIRRGDRVGMSWKYHSSHIPVENYVQAAQATLQRLNLTQPVIYIASDSPYAQQTFINNLSPDTRIYSLSQSREIGLRTLASPEPYVQSDFNLRAEDDRVKLTKGMIVDFALLSGMWPETDPQCISAATVCGLSSNVCRLLAVGFGWEGAFGDLEDGIDDEKKRWVEIDNAGQIMPVWEAFEVFP